MRSKQLFLTLAIITITLTFDPSVIFAETNPSTTLRVGHEQNRMTNLQYFFGDSSRYNDVVVEDVISADTIKLTNGETIKLIGLRAPDPPKRKRTVEYDRYGFPVEDRAEEPTTSIEEQAFRFAQHLLKGKHIHLEFDVEKKDLDLKTLAYVFLLKGDLFVNAEIIRQGFANLHLTASNKKHERELREAYQEAKEEKRGLQSE